jgi:flavin reductase (DIM6/NTAB) family NADH-FMN oxidoreductase RutF
MSRDSVAGVLLRLSPEIWIITAADGPRRGGLVSTTVAQASIVPEMPRIAVGIAKQHATWPLIDASGSFVAHLIDEPLIDWVWRFGLQSSRDVDKFDGLELRTASSGAPILARALAWIACRVEARLDTGDRTLYLAEVIDGGLARDANPLTMQRMLELASADHRRELKNALARDAQIDAAAIRRWRGEQAKAAETQD